MRTEPLSQISRKTEIKPFSVVKTLKDVDIEHGGSVGQGHSAGGTYTVLAQVSLGCSVLKGTFPRVTLPSAAPLAGRSTCMC